MTGGRLRGRWLVAPASMKCSVGTSEREEILSAGGRGMEAMIRAIDSENVTVVVAVEEIMRRGEGMRGDVVVLVRRQG